MGLGLSILAGAQVLTKDTALGTNSILSQPIGLVRPLPQNIQILAPLVGTNAQRKVISEAQKAPAPGIYRTIPFACIVVVPGKNPDDQMIIRPAENLDRTPVLNPDLHFVPMGLK